MVSVGTRKHLRETEFTYPSYFLEKILFFTWIIQ